MTSIAVLRERFARAERELGIARARVDLAQAMLARRAAELAGARTVLDTAQRKAKAK